LVIEPPYDFCTLTTLKKCGVKNQIEES
jgi:hypothetical protein